MDKYEFNIKVEQIKKMASERDYVTAMKIADSIDWSRVRNANLLSMVAGVYEKNNEYQEAKDILLMAFERAPVGKRLLYKLAEVSVKSGDIEEAEDFYREFVDLAPEDSRAFLLEYMILKAKGAPPAQLIHSLEQYTSQELDERWLYELAMLYARAGMGEECVRACDKITLLFGLGKYSERAMQLKQQFTELSDYQRDLVGNPEKYENKLSGRTQAWIRRRSRKAAMRTKTRNLRLISRLMPWRWKWKSPMRKKRSRRRLTRQAGRSCRKPRWSMKQTRSRRITPTSSPKR